MSQQPPYSAPPPPPSGDPGPPLPTHTSGETRPGTRGIWVGIVLMVVGIALPVAVGFFLMKPFTTADAVFPADGEPHLVELPAEEKRGLFLREFAHATCTGQDADGNEVVAEGLGASTYTVNDWEAAYRFDTGAGDVTFTCESATEGAEVRIGTVPGVGGMVGAMLGSCGVGLLLGVGGLVLLVITAVRRSRAG